MDALGLQAALMKLDPATTVTPIGAGVKMMPPPPPLPPSQPRHRSLFGVEIDDTDLTLRNVFDIRDDEKSSSSISGGQNTLRKFEIGNGESNGGCSSSASGSTGTSTVQPSLGTNNLHHQQQQHHNHRYQSNHKNSASSSTSTSTSTSSSRKLGTGKTTIAEVR